MKTRRLIKRSQSKRSQSKRSQSKRSQSKRSQSKRTIRKHTKTHKYQKTKHWRHTTLKKGGDEEGIVNEGIEGDITRFIGPNLEPKENFPHYSFAKNRPKLKEEAYEYANIGEEQTDIKSNPWERIEKEEEIYYTPRRNESMRPASMRPASMRPVKNNNIPLYALHPLDKNDIKRINKGKINDNDLIYICTDEFKKIKPKIQEFLKEKLNKRYGELRKLVNSSENLKKELELKNEEIEKYDTKYKEKANNNFKSDKPGRKEEMEDFLDMLEVESEILTNKYENAKEVETQYNILKDENATEEQQKEAEEIIERLIPGYIKNKESYEKIKKCWDFHYPKNIKEEEEIEEALYADLPFVKGGRKTRKKRKHSHLRSKKHRLRI